MPVKPAAEQTIAGHRVVRQLGEGGMGRVYLAEDDTLGRRVAIKVILGDLERNAEARARFLREARAMANVEHPNIVRIYSFGDDKDGAFIVMEYVEGEMLADRIARGPLPVDEALRITREVIDALEAAWEKQIVHRDIKPSNVLLDRRDRVHVADFGLAKPLALKSDNTLTQTGYMLGSPHYIAPEQARGQESDFRSDIYSLGIMLYEMLAGEKPFRGTSPFSVVAQHLHEPMPKLDRADVPDNVMRLVQRMTAKDPDDRPASYAELKELLSGSGVEALRPARARRRLHPAWLLLALIPLAVYFWPRSTPQQLNASTAQNRSFSVAVTPFYGPDDASAKEGRNMAALVERAITERLVTHDVRVIGIAQTKDPVQSEAAARELARRLDVAVVVWGQAFVINGDAEIQPYFTLNIPPPRPLDDNEGIRVAEVGDVRDRRGEQFRLAAQSPNQIELRKTNAGGIGDIVVTLAGLYALRSGDAKGALELLSQAPKSGETMRNRTLALVDLHRTEDARNAALEAVQLDPKDAHGHILLADLDADTGRWSEAASEYLAAAAIDPHVSSARAFVDNGKLYSVEWFQHAYLSEGNAVDTPYLLGRDPATGRVLERHYLPGIPRGYTRGDRDVEIRYASGSPAVKDQTIHFANGTFDLPLNLPAQALWRMRTTKSSLPLVVNFIKEDAGYHFAAHPHFAPSAQPFRDEPNTYAELDAKLREAIDRDPTQPWHRYWLTLSLVSQGRRAEADAVWRQAMADRAMYRGTPYFEFGWMVRSAMLYGLQNVADDAYNLALEKRRAMPQPVAFRQNLDQVINAPFERWAARMARQGGWRDTAREYEWLQRGREIGGVPVDGEYLASPIWSKYFRSKGNVAAAEREEAYARTLVSYPINRLAAAEQLDLAIYAALASLFALLILGIATFFGAQRDRRVIAIAVLAFGASVAWVAIAVRSRAAQMLPAGVSDALGNPVIVERFEQRVAARPTSERRWLAAIANQYEGNYQRAGVLYNDVDDERATASRDAAMAALKPVNPPAAEDFVRAWQPVSVENVLHDEVALGMGEKPLYVTERRVAVACVFVALLALVLLVVRTRTSAPRFIDVIIPGLGDIVRGRAFRGWITSAAFALTLIAIFIRYRLEEGISLGFEGLGMVSNVVNTTPLPNPKGLSEAALIKSYYWSLFWGYPWMIAFTVLVAIAAAYTIAAHVLYLRSRKMPECRRTSISSTTSSSTERESPTEPAPAR